METLEIMPVRVKVTAVLKKAILSGEYKKGEQLSLTDVSNTLGVSRTPVREAFQALEAEGLIKLRMNRGAIVKGVDEKFEVKEAKERESFVNKDYYEDLNQRIHTAIWKAADNQRLYAYLLSLWNGPSIGKNTSASDHYRISTDEHIATLEAIGARNVEGARRVMVDHITRSMDNILAGLKK